MIRIVLIALLGLGCAFFLYLTFTQKKNIQTKKQKPFRPKPKHFMGILLVLVLILGLGFLLMEKDNAPTKVYHPPEWRDGKIIPGYFE